MSPEQADMRGSDIDTRADVYSLGVVLYITRPMFALATDKIASLRRVITDSACIDKFTKRKLLSLMDRVDRDLSRSKYTAVISTLNEIDAIVESNPKAFGTCTVNLAAEIQARVRSANFTLSKAN